MDPLITPAILQTMQIIGMPVDLCLVGMPKAGKTSFLHALQNEFNKETAPTFKITKIKIKKRNIDGKNYRITVYDTSGKKEDHSENIESLLNTVESLGNMLNPFKDFILLFFCNVKDLLDDEEYKKQVNARLKHINTVIANHIIKKQKVIMVLTTHGLEKANNLSKLEKEDLTKLSQKINCLFIDKEYGDFTKFFVNLNDKKSVEQILEYIPQLYPFYHKYA